LRKITNSNGHLVSFEEWIFTNPQLFHNYSKKIHTKLKMGVNTILAAACYLLPHCTSDKTGATWAQISWPYTGNTIFSPVTFTLNYANWTTHSRCVLRWFFGHHDGWLHLLWSRRGFWLLLGLGSRLVLLLLHLRLCWRWWKFRGLKALQQNRATACTSYMFTYWFY